jgi:hypothetical protein
MVVAGCGGEPDAAPRWRLDFVSESRSMFLSEVIPVSKDEGWAVAYEASQNGDGSTTLLHRDGTRWRAAEVPHALDEYYGGEISTLAASSPDNVWVFGTLVPDDVNEERAPGALRWDGDRWERKPAPVLVKEAVAFAPDDVWAVGSSAPDGVVYHWDGAQWATELLPGIDYLGTIAGGEGDVWLTAKRGGETAVFRHTGTGWQETPVPEEHLPAPTEEDESSVTDLVRFADDDVWAFGSVTQTTPAQPDAPHRSFAWHWNGTQWRTVPNVLDDENGTPTDSAVLAASDGAGGLVLVATFGRERHRTKDGKVTLIGEPEPVAGRTDEITDEDRRQHFQAHDIEPVPGTREVWAVGGVGVSPAMPGKEYIRGVVASYVMG